MPFSVFCEKSCGEKLSRYIRLVHKDEEVKKAVLLPKREQDKEFFYFQKTGIYKVNRKHMMSDDESPKYE